MQSVSEQWRTSEIIKIPPCKHDQSEGDINNVYMTDRGSWPGAVGLQSLGPDSFLSKGRHHF